MFGLIGKIKAVEGRAAELAEVLMAGSASMPGCLSYVVARDPGDPDALWVTEVWTDEASHKASLETEVVRTAIAKGRPLIAGFEQHVATEPLAGSHGLASAR